MKTRILLLVFSLVAFSSFSQSFPVQSKNRQSILDYAIKEGTYAGVEILSTSVIAPTTGSITVGGATFSVTECFYAQSAVMSVTGGTAISHLQYYSGPNNNSVGETNHRIPLNNGRAEITLNTIMLPRTGITYSLRNGDGTTPLMTSANIGGYRLTADLNFAASKVILWIGDSILRGSAMDGTSYSNYADVTATTPDDHFAFKVRNALNAAKKDTRLVLKAMGSYTSRMMGVYRKQGGLTIDQADLIIYQLGVNDATGTTTDQQFSDELDAIIALRNSTRAYWSSPILFVGPTPLNNNTHETRLAQLRSIMAAKANAEQKIYFVSCANDFDRTVLGNYAGNDGVHPSQAKQLAMATTIGNYILTNITF